ncbi:peptidoglycan-binding protein [Amycolatopsis sp. NPDC058278]|uniref:peptidoglycan-binding protein n=1 Tax=Amycolatopsis sp. NPDC058278 TaxID=3346417 RepID=UPI0036DCA6EC
MNRRAIVATGSAVLVVGAAAAATIGFGGHGSAPPSPATDLPPATAPVIRTTLTQTQDVNGTLGHGTPVPVTASGPGTITWLPEPGSVVDRGRPVCKRDDRPVPLLLGRLPLYRELRSGLDGDDVKEVEENLAALGYRGFTVDSSYTAATASAVRKWQGDLGLVRTGALDPAAVVVAPTAFRVASVTGRVGDHAGGQLLTYTGTTRGVQIALPVALQTLVRPGIAATIKLPDAKTVHGTVATVGSVAVAGRQEGDPATIAVTVGVAEQAALGSLDEAPVTVKLVSATVRDVLTVPVAALTVFPDGRYAVRVVTGSAGHLVAVDLGMFADGRVQVSGDRITESTRVGVPS